MSVPTVQRDLKVAGNELKRHTKLPLSTFVGFVVFLLGNVVVVVGGAEVVVVVGVVVVVVVVEPTDVVVVGGAEVVVVVGVVVVVVVVVVVRIVGLKETGRYRKLARN